MSSRFIFRTHRVFRAIGVGSALMFRNFYFQTAYAKSYSCGLDGSGHNPFHAHIPNKACYDHIVNQPEHYLNDKNLFFMKRVANNEKNMVRSFFSKDGEIKQFYKGN